MTMLKGVPSCLSPQLLQVLASMGHGDCLVLADANFPSASVGAATVAGVVRADGLSITELLPSVLRLLPLDTYAPSAYLMQKEPQDAALDVVVWKTYSRAIDAAEGRSVELQMLPRNAFYDFAKTAYAVVATSETALYGNIILRKGVISQ